VLVGVPGPVYTPDVGHACTTGPHVRHPVCQYGSFFTVSKEVTALLWF